MIDTHTHLYLPEFSSEGEADGGANAVRRALEAGVEQMVFPNVDLESYEPMMELHARFPEVTHVGIGMHPTSVDASWRDALQRTEELIAATPEAVAIGEVGIDLYWDATYRSEQREVFAHQIAIAADRQLPVIVHCREGLQDTLDVLRTFGSALPVMIFHSFTGSPADVEAIRCVTDAWFGINGVVTFKNAASLREALPHIGLERMLTETDSPYLAPVPKRGRRNESAYIPYIVGAIASTLALTPEDVAAATSSNARKVFSI